MGTLTYTAGSVTVNLPDDLSWPDEFSWQAVAQSKSRSVTGALIIETGLKKSGRPITLRSDDSTAWLPRASAAALYGLTQIPGAELTLGFRGQTFDVLFDHESGPLEVTPVVDFADPADEDNCLVVLRFITRETA